jgi:hypothetical protein
LNLHQSLFSTTAQDPTSFKGRTTLPLRNVLSILPLALVRQQTGGTVIVTFYGTLVHWCLQQVKVPIPNLEDEESDDYDLQLEDEDEEEFETDDADGNAALKVIKNGLLNTDDERRRLRLKWKNMLLKGRTGRVADEAHLIKNPRTKAAEAIRRLFLDHKWFLTIHHAGLVRSSVIDFLSSVLPLRQEQNKQP